MIKPKESLYDTGGDDYRRRVREMISRNPYESAARLRKVQSLIDKLDEINDGQRVTHDQIAALTAAEWHGVARLAGVKEPSPEAISLLLAYLKSRQ